MEFSYNRSIPKDLQDAIDYYDRVSDTKGDQFFEELLSAVKEISQNPQRFPPFQETRLRKARLRKFPYHVLYQIKAHSFRILVLRHDSRHPSFGIHRK